MANPPQAGKIAPERPFPALIETRKSYPKTGFLPAVRRQFDGGRPPGSGPVRLRGPAFVTKPVPAPEPVTTRTPLSRACSVTSAMNRPDDNGCSKAAPTCERGTGVPASVKEPSPDGESLGVRRGTRHHQLVMSSSSQPLHPVVVSAGQLHVPFRLRQGTVPQPPGWGPEGQALRDPQSRPEHDPHGHPWGFPKLRGRGGARRAKVTVSALPWATTGTSGSRQSSSTSHNPAAPGPPVSRAPGCRDPAMDRPAHRFRRIGNGNVLRKGVQREFAIVAPEPVTLRLKQTFGQPTVRTQPFPRTPAGRPIL